MTNLPEAMKRAGVVNQANQDVAAGNDHLGGQQVSADPVRYDSMEGQQLPGINWEAHKRFMRGM